MLTWLNANLGNIVVILILLVIVFFSFRSVIRNRRAVPAIINRLENLRVSEGRVPP